MIERTVGCRAACFALCAALFGLGMPGEAHAGDPDELVKIAPRPPGSKVVALASMNGGNGLVYSRDGGETFSALCTRIATAVVETSRGPDPVFMPSFETLIVTHDERVLVGSFHGLWIDDGHGCGWELLPEMRSYVSVLVHDPLDPKIIYGATATGGGADNGIFRFNEDGSFDVVGATDTYPIYSLKVVELPGGGRRFYKLFVTEQVLFDIDAGVPVELTDAEIPPQGTRSIPSYSVAYSDDGAETWIEHVIGPDEGAGSLRIEAVDPTNPDRLVMSLRRFGGGGTPDILLVSDDRGATRREWHSVLAVSAVTFAPDGQLWIGDSGEGSVDRSRGLWHAASTDSAPELVTDAYKTNCAEWRDGKLEVCSLDRYGVADLTSGELTPSFSAGTLATAHVCEDKDVVATCQQSFCTGRCKHWPDAPFCVEQYQATLESCGRPAETAPADASVAPEPTTSDDAGPTPPAADDGGCGCRIAGRPERRSATGALLSVLIAVVVGVRRRARAAS